jgi:hypothetical protein
MNIPEPSRAVTVLLAAATLMGIERALEVLQAERMVVKNAVNLHNMTIGDFADAFVPRTLATSRGRQLSPQPQRQVRAPKNARAILAACKPLLAKGPTKIADILKALHSQKLIADTGPETRRQVSLTIEGDATFSVRTRGVYAIRGRKAA